MAEEEPIQGMGLVGMEDIPATFADVFLVTADAESELVTVYFLQRQLSLTTVQKGTLELRPKSAKCVARIMLSKKGAQTLFQAMADNQGVDISQLGKRE